MQDPRVDRLADLLTGYSLALAPGQVVRLDGEECAAPLLLALYRSALLVGAHPYTNLEPEGVFEVLLAEGSDAQLERLAPSAWQEIEELDAYVTIWSERNTKGLSSVPPDRLGHRLAARKDHSRRRRERMATGELRWCGTLFPTEAHAQDAEMTLEEYERFVFGACHVQEAGDASAHWRATSASLTARAAELGAVRELRVLGPDTDLRLGVAGRRWLPAEGRSNMPDGEIYTSPLETATQGEIRFAFPAVYEGREAEDVRLRFDGGEVVRAEARLGNDYLQSLLAQDGARVLGEVAFGLNYEIDRFTRNILFDEKIGGTMHFALGFGFPETGSEHLTAGIHWDMICDLREEGEVYADGELIWRAGRFLDDAGARDA